MLHINRRQFLKVTAATTIATATGIGLLALSAPDSQLYLTINSALERLSELGDKTLVSTGQWDAAQVLNHCAQSVEYSMTGYPEHKSEFFKQTIGSLAFSVFSLKGSMNHGLSEAIPGATILNAGDPVDLALVRLQQSFADFNQFDGRLAPHFAYGDMTKAQYARAHVLHLNQHLQQIQSS